MKCTVLCQNSHCMKNVHIRSFFRSVYSRIRTRKNSQGWQHRGRRGLCPPHPPPHPIFLRSKKKKGEQKKERISKQKLLKGCHQGQQVTVLAILERLEFKHFFSQPTTVADNTFYCSTLKSFSPALYFGLVSPYTFSSGKM